MPRIINIWKRKTGPKIPKNKGMRANDQLIVHTLWDEKRPWKSGNIRDQHRNRHKKVDLGWCGKVAKKDMVGAPDLWRELNETSKRRRKTWYLIQLFTIYAFARFGAGSSSSSSFSSALLSSPPVTSSPSSELFDPDGSSPSLPSSSSVAPASPLRAVDGPGITLRADRSWGFWLLLSGRACPYQLGCQRPTPASALLPPEGCRFRWPMLAGGEDPAFFWLAGRPPQLSCNCQHCPSALSYVAD